MRSLILASGGDIFMEMWFTSVEKGLQRFTSNRKMRFYFTPVNIYFFLLDVYVMSQIVSVTLDIVKVFC